MQIDAEVVLLQHNPLYPGYQGLNSYETLSMIDRNWLDNLIYHQIRYL